MLKAIHSHRVLMGCALAISSTAALWAHSPNPVAGSSELHAAYLILGSAERATVAYARAVIAPGFTCPLVVDSAGKSRAMVTRDNPHGFPVVVCEAQIDLGADYSLALGDGSVSLPPVKVHPTKVHVFGDTGCKSSDCAPGTPAEPFASMAAVAARQAPDLVLHMGDANYRGTPSSVMFTADGAQGVQYTYDAGDGSTTKQQCEQSAGDTYYSQNESNSNFPDQWETWRDDFFRPAAPLLAAAPWVIARGNHELCSRAGPGWFYFLDQSSNLNGGQLACPVPDPTAPPLANSTLGPPYAVQLGTLNLIVIDSANACDSFLNPIFAEKYEAQFKLLPSLTGTSGTTWVMHHRPLWGVNEFTSDESAPCTTDEAYGCINQTLQEALRKSLDGKLPRGIELVLSGHMHRFQSVTFPRGRRPPQIIVGSSGVALDTGKPDTSDFGVKVSGENARVVTSNDKVTHDGLSYPAFGYLAIELNQDGWTGTVENGSGLPLASCASTLDPDSVCFLASD